MSLAGTASTAVSSVDRVAIPMSLPRSVKHGPTAIASVYITFKFQPVSKVSYETPCCPIPQNDCLDCPRCEPYPAASFSLQRHPRIHGLSRGLFGEATLTE